MSMFLRTWVACLVLTASLAGSLPADQAPELDIPPVALKGPLLPMHEEKIAASLTYYTQVIQKAKDDDQPTIDSGRAGLIQTFRYSESMTYRYAAAKFAAEIVTPLLEDDSRIKQINAALVLSTMPQVTIQPALEKMIVHGNPAVRYYGWRGYRNAWTYIVSQGAKPAGTMFDSLGRRADDEPSPIVMGAIWEMLRLRGDPTTVPGDLGNPREHAFNILRASWRKRCGQVMAGDLAMLDAVRKGLATVIEYAANAQAANRDQTAKEAVRMAAELTWCAGKAYQAASKAEKVNVPAIRAAETLLQDCERSLNELLGLGPLNRRDFIRFPLKDSSVKDNRGDAIIYHKHPRTSKDYGVLAWVDELKERFKIEKPRADMFRRKAVTRPTRTPAGK